MKKLSEEDVLAILTQVRNGSFLVTRRRFRNALKRSIGAHPNYADGCYKYFADSPLHYICSRTSNDQKLELIRICLRLGRVYEKENPRI